MWRKWEWNKNQKNETILCHHENENGNPAISKFALLRPLSNQIFTNHCCSFISLSRCLHSKIDWMTHSFQKTKTKNKKWRDVLWFYCITFDARTFWLNNSFGVFSSSFSLYDVEIEFVYTKKWLWWQDVHLSKSKFIYMRSSYIIYFFSFFFCKFIFFVCSAITKTQSESERNVILRGHALVCVWCNVIDMRLFCCFCIWFWFGHIHPFRSGDRKFIKWLYT